MVRHHVKTKGGTKKGGHGLSRKKQLEADEERRRTEELNDLDRFAGSSEEEEDEDGSDDDGGSDGEEEEVGRLVGGEAGRSWGQ